MDELELIVEAGQEIRSILERNPKFDEVERLRLENCMAMLQMTYIEWKRRNVPPDPPYWRSPFDVDTKRERTPSSRDS